jgi:hypothetical protein
VQAFCVDRRYARTVLAFASLSIVRAFFVDIRYARTSVEKSHAKYAECIFASYFIVSDFQLLFLFFVGHLGTKRKGVLPYSSPVFACTFLVFLCNPLHFLVLGTSCTLF